MVKEIIAKSKKQGNKIVLVDDEDFDRISAHRWTVAKSYNTFYAFRSDNTSGKRRTILMHREIMGFPKLDIDHKNRNGLDNQKSNLRLATPGQNTANSKLNKKNTSGYRGVSWIKKRKKWKAQAYRRYIGGFNTKEEAARAYDKAMLEKHGEFAILNFEGSRL